MKNHNVNRITIMHRKTKKVTQHIFALFALYLMVNACTRANYVDVDRTAIADVIRYYDQSWDTKNVEGVLKGYTETIDWTNAFGDRVQGKDELRALLNTIFSLDFVMSGSNNYQDPEITFLDDDSAIVRSVNIRKGQQWPNGTPMADRIINHLRVFEKSDGKWLCSHHMISQAHDKTKN